ncbi:hypothetical protein MHK_003642 [Candidatus Magnetomorum sp. HK-1]|jgi:predicted transcriptional regulator of viral defense system|nr:hypothetical protein MHK_003642 [Candidatus Magnetomorum sp. HK-1]
MQTLTKAIWKLNPPYGIFNTTVIRNLFPDLSSGAQKAIVFRATQKEEIITLKPGLYCLNEQFRDKNPHPFLIASLLYTPSYISMESALKYHGLIPEAIYQVISVSTHRSKTFKTPLGNYFFSKVPCQKFRAGVKCLKINDNTWVFIADPVRAIADLIYKNKEVTWKTDHMRYIYESLRIEHGDLLEFFFTGFDDVYNSISNKRVKEFLKGIKEELSV